MESSQFDVLPPEMMVEFLLKLNLADLTNFCKTSHAAMIYCQDDQFWKDKYKHDFPNLPSDSNVSWKEQYKSAHSVPKSPISVGNRYYAIIDNQNMLYIGGDPSFDGTPNYHYKNAYDEILSKISPFKQKVRSISCGNKYTGAVTEDGKVYFWGKELHYIFGGDKKAIIYRPREFKIEGKAIKIACGKGLIHHNNPPTFAVILEDRTVFLILYHFFTHTGLEWIKISSKLNIKALDISVSSWGLAIVSTDGKLYYLGRGFGTRHGEKIGIIYKENQISVNPVHIPVPEIIKQVSIGSGHICVLSTKGNVYLWGSNYWGQLGKGWKPGNEYIESKEYMIDNPQKLSFPAPISFITCEILSTAVIDKNGKLYIWGKNNNFKEPSECIDIDEGVTYCPIQIGVKLSGSGTAIKKKFNYVSIGGGFLIATTSDGWINIWENNN